jgi:hypothetical protein
MDSYEEVEEIVRMHWQENPEMVKKFVVDILPQVITAVNKDPHNPEICKIINSVNMEIKKKKEGGDISENTEENFIVIVAIIVIGIIVTVIKFKLDADDAEPIEQDIKLRNERRAKEDAKSQIIADQAIKILQLEAFNNVKVYELQEQKQFIFPGVDRQKVEHGPGIVNDFTVKELELIPSLSYYTITHNTHVQERTFTDYNTNHFLYPWLLSKKYKNKAVFVYGDPNHWWYPQKLYNGKEIKDNGKEIKDNSEEIKDNSEEIKDSVLSEKFKLNYKAPIDYTDEKDVIWFRTCDISNAEKRINFLSYSNNAKKIIALLMSVSKWFNKKILTAVHKEIVNLVYMPESIKGNPETSNLFIDSEYYGYLEKDRLKPKQIEELRELLEQWLRRANPITKKAIEEQTKQKELDNALSYFKKNELVHAEVNETLKNRNRDSTVGPEIIGANLGGF